MSGVGFGESVIKASLGNRPSFLGTRDRLASVVAPAPGHATLHTQITRFRWFFTIPNSPRTQTYTLQKHYYTDHGA